jgi:ABC-type dipeptide/oligopeptide/nickel transport system permease component
MMRFLFRRILQSLIVLYLFLTAVFFLTQVIMVGDFAIISRWGQGVEEVRALRQELGLDQPIWQQYLRWLGDVLTGDLGRSYYTDIDPATRQEVRVSVGEIIGTTLLISCIVSVTGTLIAFRIGEWLGKTLAWQKSRLFTGAATLVSILLYTAFPPLLVFVMVELTSSLNFFCPPRCLNRALWGPDLTSPLGSFRAVALYMLVTIAAVMLLLALVNQILQRLFKRRLPAPLYILLLIGIWLGGWSLAEAGPWMLDLARSASLIVVIYVLLVFGETLLIMRTSMLDVLCEDHVFTARAKGLPDRVVQDRHVARNALLPVLSRLIINIPYLLAGLVMIEHGIGFTGIGRALLQSLDSRDTPTFMGAFLVVGVVALAAHLVLDIVVAVLDPRVRLVPASAAIPRRAPGTRGVNPIRALKLRLRGRRSLPGRRVGRAVVRRNGLRLRRPRPVDLAGRWRRLRQRLRLSWRRFGESWRIFARNRLAVAGVALIALFALMAVAQPILMATVWPRQVYDPWVGIDLTIFPHPSSPSISSGHLLGTDALGRDTLSMLLASTPATFAVALTAAFTAAATGTLLGAIAAYFRGTVVDTVLGYLADVLLAMPAPILMIIISTRFIESVGYREFGLLYGLVAGASTVFLMMRSQALRLMAQPFIEASRAAGAGATRIILVHLVPHMLPLAAVQMMLTVANAVITYGFISFVGVVEFRLNWGAMVYFALTMMGTSSIWAVSTGPTWAHLLSPGLALSLFAAAFYFVSRGLHEVAEPRLRER